MTKAEIRQQIIDVRSSMQPERRGLSDQLIFERAHKHKVFQRARLVHVYHSTSVEVRSMPFIEYAWAIGKTVTVPRVHRENGRLEHVVVDHRTRWEAGAFGILEPARTDGDTLLDDSDFTATDAVIVPLVAFDRDCHRIGYGKGYYDRFLAATSAVKIGIAYECQRVPAIPHESHDIQLDAIATEERWYAPSRH
jgi:5-formyltetrahydrofolate cyclo-ligase